MTKIQFYRPYFWVGDMQDLNIFGCKIFRKSMFWGLNFTLHTHTPVYKHMKYPPEIERHPFHSDILDCDGVFIEFNKNAYRDFTKGKSSGGTHLVIRKIIQSYCTVMKHDAYRAWVRWVIIKAIYIRFMYIPPSTSPLLR